MKEMAVIIPVVALFSAAHPRLKSRCFSGRTERVYGIGAYIDSWLEFWTSCADQPPSLSAILGGT